MPQSLALLVLGPHRSGTSAFTRVFNLLGVDLGSEMLPPKADNRQGFWEHGEIFEIHEQLLSWLGSAWHEHRPLPSGWHRREGVERFRQMLVSFLRREFAGKPLWGVKDPRLCRLVPLWLDALEELEVDTAFVLVVRNPLEVIRSLEVRNQFPPNKSLLLYLADMLAAIHDTRGLRRVFASYWRLLEDWRQVVTEVGRGLELEWPQEPRQQAEEIDSYLRPSERHHRHTLADLAGVAFVPPWCHELQRALEGAARDGGGAAQDPAFDRACEAFRAASALFGPELDRLEHRASRAMQAHAAAEEEVLRLRRSKEPPPDGPPYRPAAERSEGAQGNKGGEPREQAGQVAGLEERQAQLQEALELAHRERALIEERQQQLQRRARRAEDELRKVQKHLTSILSSRWYRYTRRIRRGWEWVSRFV